MAKQINGLFELIVNQFIRNKFDREMYYGHKQPFIKVDHFDSLESYMYFVVFVTDCSLIRNETLNISISNHVKIEMLQFIHETYEKTCWAFISLPIFIVKRDPNSVCQND